MSIAPNSIPQQDTLTAPIIEALITVAQQIQNIGYCYPEVPDAPPEDGSVLFAPIKIGVRDDETNGKLVLSYQFEIDHLFARKRLQDNLASILAAVPAWLTVLTAWSNQTLGGLVQNTNLTEMNIKPYVHAKQEYLALQMVVTVRPIININLS